VRVIPHGMNSLARCISAAEPCVRAVYACSIAVSSPSDTCTSLSSTSRRRFLRRGSRFGISTVWFL